MIPAGNRNCSRTVTSTRLLLHVYIGVKYFSIGSGCECGSMSLWLGTVQCRPGQMENHEHKLLDYSSTSKQQNTQINRCSVNYSHASEHFTNSNTNFDDRATVQSSFSLFTAKLRRRQDKCYEHTCIKIFTFSNSKWWALSPVYTVKRYTEVWKGEAVVSYTDFRKSLQTNSLPVPAGTTWRKIGMAVLSADIHF